MKTSCISDFMINNLSFQISRYPLIKHGKSTWLKLFFLKQQIGKDNKYVTDSHNWVKLSHIFKPCVSKQYHNLTSSKNIFLFYSKQIISDQEKQISKKVKPKSSPFAQTCPLVFTHRLSSVRTRDLARKLPDGTLEYCGRADGFAKAFRGSRWVVVVVVSIRCHRVFQKSGWWMLVYDRWDILVKHVGLMMFIIVLYIVSRNCAEE